MLNEDMLLKTLKNNFDKTLDKVDEKIDEKIDEQVYDMLPCYIKKKPIIKITKDKLKENLVFYDIDVSVFCINYHLELSEKKIYNMNILDNEYFMFEIDGDDTDLLYYIENDLGIIEFYPNVFSDPEQQAMVENYNYFTFVLIGKYSNIATDLEIYEVEEIKKIPNSLLPNDIYLENGEIILGNVNDGSDCTIINRNGIKTPYFNNIDHDHIKINKPIYFYKSPTDFYSDYYLVNKRYVDNKVGDNSYFGNIVNEKMVFEHIMTDKEVDIFTGGMTGSKETITIDRSYNLNKYTKYKLQIYESTTYLTLNDNDQFVGFINNNSHVGHKVLMYNKDNKIQIELTKRTAINGGSSGTHYIRLYEISVKPNKMMLQDMNILNNFSIGIRSNEKNSVGKCSFTSGLFNKARGFCSAALGENTLALYDHQCVIGKNNITNNDYAYIIGNGISDLDRSNAHTVDWQGNAWYSGNVSIDGTPTNNKDLTTKKYVDDSILSSQTTNEEFDTYLNELYGGE